MKIRAWSLVIFCAVALSLLCGCAPAARDPFAAFRGEFTAEIRGTVNGVELEAVLEAAPVGEGPRAVTVTVYAPSGLSGTVLRQGADGQVWVTAGSIEAQAPAAAGFCALFDLFPVTGEVTGVSLDSEGHTAVNFAGGTVTLLPDGTPYGIKTQAATVRVVSFAAGSQ